MTGDQWGQLEAFICSNWQNAKQQPLEHVQMRFRVVADLEFDATLEALLRMVRGGREFPPNPGQLYAAVTQDRRDPPPAPGTIIALLRRAAGTFGRDREADALRWLAMQVGGKHAARFAVEHGWRQFCMEGLDDPEHGGAVRHRIEQSAASSAAGLEREYREGRVIEMVGRRLQQLDAGDQARGLRHLNTMSVLIERPQIEAGSER